MQDIDQNMDDLFRKAAADYPLKLNESRWDDIAPLVVQSPLNGALTPKTISRKYAGLLTIFFLLLLTTGLITNTFKPVMQIDLLPSQAENKTNNTGIAFETGDHTKNKITEKKQSQQHHYPGQSTLQSIIDYSSLIEKKEMLQKKSKDNDSFETKSKQSSENCLVNTILLTKNAIETSNNIDPVVEQETLAENNKIEVGKDSISQTENTNRQKISGLQKGIYLGAVAGPLFDEVKNQGLKKTGFSAGMIAGYQFKNHLSVETGLLYAKKPYFSTGKYFSMDKISNTMPAGMEILSLEGNNYVLEMPVKIKYDFLLRNKSNFFLSAGITSYINTHEKNNYLVFINGSQQSMISSYKNKSRSLAATVDISVGYEHKINKSNRIRVEPYLQIPIRGMGWFHADDELWIQNWDHKIHPLTALRLFIENY